MKPSVRHDIAALLAEPLALGEERLPGALDHYTRLSSDVAALVLDLANSRSGESAHHRDLRDLLAQLVSLESAAGAPPSRCRHWFLLLSALDAWTPPGSDVSISAPHAAAWSALAGEYHNEDIKWPLDLTSMALPDLALYRLYTRRPAVFEGADLHDDLLWVGIVQAVEVGEAQAATAAFVALADWWLQEYESSGTAGGNPEQYLSFEPLPNAALALCTVRDGMAILPQGVDRQRFYYVALMLLSQE